MLLVALPSWSDELQRKNGHVPHAVASLRPVGLLEGTRRLDLAIGLPLRNREALTKLLQDLYDPASPEFRRFLTPAQFVDRFAPTEQDYQAVIEFARSNHLVLTGTHANRLLLDVNGTAADIEKAFHTRIGIYQHPIERRTFYSPEFEPSVEASLPILSISGLDDFAPPRPMDFRGKFTTGPRPKAQAALDASGSGPSGTFLGLDFRTAYAPDVPWDGSGESVGLLELDSYYPNDVAEYETLAGLPSVPLTNVLVKGFNRAPGFNNGEVALDIAMAISMAPGLASVLVYEGSNGNDVLNRMATDNLARQLSSSWSFGQAVDPTRQQIFQQFAAQGQSFFQASGDSGAFGTALVAPADDPFVTSVGGTALTTAGPGGAWVDESAWSSGGGGISASYAIPSWQKAVSNGTNQGSLTMRNIPDVAALAFPSIWIIANNGEQGTVGGTSASAPLWAGFMALVNQKAAANGQSPPGFLNPALYAIGLGPAGSSAFHDVVSGNNTNAVSPTRFFAGPGYDLCTGWGTPRGNSTIDALLSPVDALRISPGSDQVLSGPTGGPFKPPTSGFVLTNAGLGPISWALAFAPSWLDASPQSGTLLPGGAPASLSVALNSSAFGIPPGTYAAALWFTNLNNGFAQRRLVTLNIVTPPLITNQPADLSLPSGATAQFTVGVSTNSLLFYQWFINGNRLMNGSRISGTTSAVLSLSNVTPTDAGIYSVSITNAAGSALSAEAHLAITSAPPTIIAQPSSQTVFPGANAIFSVSVFGDSPLSYRWQKNGTNLLDSSKISGSATTTLLVSDASTDDAGTYSVTVTNFLGSRSSLAAELDVSVLTSPEIAATVLHSFDGTHGGHPNGLSRGSDGVIYGATQTGGFSNSGTIFRLDASGTPQSRYGFSGGNDGARPNGSLVQDNQGNLFGTTYGGGSNAFGTIFQVSTNAQLTTLFTLDHTDGVLPTAGLVRGLDGFFYGTAYEGGVFHYGTVFRVGTNGAYTVLFPFASTNGGFPYAGLVRSAAGDFYGMTYKGGAFNNGTVFRISPAGLFSTVAAFNGTNGAFPVSTLIQTADGSLFGATAYGGAFGLGTLFRVSPRGSLTTLYSFQGLADGSHPRAALLQASDGNFYGTTFDGGILNAGTAFRMTPDGTLSTIAQFDGFNGANPGSALIEDGDGGLLGVTQNGGKDGQGVVFRLSTIPTVPHITSQPASLTLFSGATATFEIASYGSSPLLYQWRKNGVNLADSGNVIGSASRSLVLTNLAASDKGVYSVIVSNSAGFVTSAPATLEVLVSAPFFNAQPTNQTLLPGATAVLHAIVAGTEPLAYQWQRDGTNLVDTGNWRGVNTDTLTLTNITEENNGTYVLFVTNSLGATNSFPASLLVVPVSAPGTRITTLYSFAGGTDGRVPSEMAYDQGGFLYGTTRFGGRFLDGTVFRIGTNGGLSTLVSFDPTNGSFPLSGVVVSTNGRVFGTTSTGGDGGYGTVWSMTPSGTLSNLYHFNGGTDGGMPECKLALATNGTLYGSTLDGGEGGHGTIFRLNEGGELTVLHSFTGDVDGGGFGGALLEQSDGNLYGVSQSAGISHQGSIFRLSPDGIFANLYSFTGGFDGYQPVGALVEGDNGDFFGATMFNTIRGFAFYGTLFRFGKDGLLTTLYALNFTDGSYPAAGLVQGADGNFYGTTQDGGATDNGTLFRLTPGGTVSTLVDFDGFDDGSKPMAALTSGPDGSLYGTTSKGGPKGQGTIFRLSFTGPLFITAQPSSQSAFTSGSARFSIAVAGGIPLGYQWRLNGTNLADGPFIQGAFERVLKLSNLLLTQAGNYSVVVTNAAGAVTSASALLSIGVAPPSFQSVARAGESLVLTWSTAPGRSYQLQSNPGLAGSWTNIGPPFPANGGSLQSSVAIGPGGRQFYRVVLLP